MSANFKIRIVQPVILEYRVALYDGLARRYGDKLEVWAADRVGQHISLPLKDVKYDYSHSINIKHGIWTQKGLSLDGLKRGDVLVVSGDVHNVSSLRMAIRAKSRGIKVVWWGQLWSASSTKFKVAVRLFIAKQVSDVFLCYTNKGASYLKAHGFEGCRVFATGNTIDQKPVKAAAAEWDNEKLLRFQSQKEIAGKNLLLLCGVLKPKVKLRLLIQAMADRRMIAADTVLAIIGDGDTKKANVELAKALGISDRVIWIDATRDQQIMAPWFLSAKVYVYPGSIGLSILHAFSYGLPVVTHGNADHQMPEFEVMEDGKTGLVFEEENVDDMIEKVVSLLKDRDRLTRMKKYCMEKASSSYSMDNMVDNFCNAIDRAAEC